MKPNSSRPFWFYRIYCLVIIAFWNITIISSVFTKTKLKNELFYLIPLLIPAIVLILSAAVFKLPYSAFGRLERTKAPYGNIIEKSACGGEIGYFRGSIPFISWFVYTEGIGFSVIGVGSGFIPFSLVRSVKKHRFAGCTIEHDSPEVRSPLIIPSSRISDAIAKLTV
jgi:membrane protease YdiL (CAAX protease family)